ncbi:MAG TPA: MBL fold metallo-hydrolase [Clostridiales bacterium]|nr:MBL fold metallo-hydrolase [Clostridiales bacterium]
MRFCSLFSGSSGNCNYIGTDNTNLLVDIGLSGIRIQNELKKININPADIDGIIVTHEHIDHVQGVGVFSRRFDIPVYASVKTWGAMACKVGQIKEDNIRYLEADQELLIKDLTITPFNISHDAVEPFGFNISNGVKKISLLTDTGCTNDYIRSRIAGFDLLLLESNHDEELLKVGSYPWVLKKRIMSEFGHLSNETAAFFLLVVLKKGGEHVFLGHLSKENNFPELAQKTVENILQKNNIKVGCDVMINMTFRDRSSRMQEI